jgi:23S rRNA pseudouridine1911/1915/1917 synthase
MATGRTHQIRKHLASLGHPVLGDKTYATGAMTSAKLRAVPRHMLHAEVIDFRSPQTGKRIHARAPLPPDFVACLKTFGLE